MRKYLIALLASAFGLIGTSAMAQIDTSPLNVQAIVNAQCNIQSVTDLDFVDYDPTSAAPDDDGQGDVTFACTRNTVYDLYVSGVRTITNGTDTLNYELYSDVGRSSVFPSALPGIPGPAADNNPITQNIYGRIAALQDVGPGLYTGTVTVTVEY